VHAEWRTFRATAGRVGKGARGRWHASCVGQGMRTPLRQQLLERILTSITLERPLVDATAKRDRDLASQLRRTLSSVALHLAEGFGTRSGNARLRFETARGSLFEAQAALRVAAAWGYVDPHRMAATLAALDQFGARLYGLARR
jgi:four helix bundle protein